MYLNALNINYFHEESAIAGWIKVESDVREYV
jgi:hypothetical protein